MTWRSIEAADGFGETLRICCKNSNIHTSGVAMGHGKQASKSLWKIDEPE